MITQATHADYVYSELLTIQSCAQEPGLVGEQVIMLYIDQTAGQAKADRRAISIPHARLLLADLTRHLDSLDKPDGFLPIKEYDGN